MSREVLHRPWCLLELYTAIEVGVPVIALEVEGHDHCSIIKEFQAGLQSSELEKLNPGSVALVQKHVEPQRLIDTITESLPTFPRVYFNPLGNQTSITATIEDIVSKMRQFSPASRPSKLESKWQFLRNISLVPNNDSLQNEFTSLAEMNGQV